MFWTTVKLALLALVAAWMATARGQLDIAWGEWQLTARPGALLVLLLLALFLLLWGGRLLRELWLLPRHVGLWRRTRRRDAGYRALLQALSGGGAAMEGETAQAANARLEKALEARKLLNKDSLSTLIAAQVAEASSNVEQAQMLYGRLQRSPDMRFVALLSLARLFRNNGDYGRAQIYAREAEALRPSSLQLWVEQIEIARQGDSPEAALAILDKIRRRGTTLPSTFQLLEAGLRIDAMRKALEAGDEKDAVRQAQLAFLASKQRGIVAYAQRLADGGVALRAQGRKLVRTHWAEFEGRALAEAFFRLHNATEPIERARLLESLCTKQPSLKSRLLLCEMLLDAKVWARATQMLDDLALKMEENYRPLADNSAADNSAAQAEWLSYNVLRARLAKEAHNDLEGQQYWLDRLAEQAQQRQQQEQAS